MTIPATAALLGVPAKRLRSFLTDNPSFLLNRAAGIQPRVSEVDAIRLHTLFLLENAGLSTTDALHVLAETADRHLTGLALCGVPVPDTTVQDHLWAAAYHIVPGRPLRIQQTQPHAAISIALDIHAVSVSIFNKEIA